MADYSATGSSDNSVSSYSVSSNGVNGLNNLNNLGSYGISSFSSVLVSSLVAAGNHRHTSDDSERKE